MQPGDKVTIIEKDANLLFGLKARLAALGFTVNADSGHQELSAVFQFIQSRKPDYLIMGSSFNNFNTIELIHKIKADDELNKIKVFIVVDDEADSTKEKELGFYRAGADYITVKRGNFYDTFSETFKRIITNLAKTI